MFSIIFKFVDLSFCSFTFIDLKLQILFVADLQIIDCV